VASSSFEMETERVVYCTGGASLRKPRVTVVATGCAATERVDGVLRQDL
jgi:hypothetical protein